MPLSVQDFPAVRGKVYVHNYNPCICRQGTPPGPTGKEWARLLLQPETMILGEPIPWARPRFKGRRGFTAPAVAAAAQTIAWTLRTRRVGKMAGAGEVVGLSIDFFFHNPRRADLDNLIKLVMDAGTGVLYEDDRQVVNVRASIFEGVDRTAVEAWAFLSGKPRRAG